MVWEILDQMPLSDMPRKVKEYFAGTGGEVRFVIIIKLERQPPPRKRKREVSDVEDSAEYPDSDADLLPGQEEGEKAHTSEEREPTSESDQPDEDPSFSPLPPVGSLTRGVFWVYGCERAATPTNPNYSEIIAIEKEQVNLAPSTLRIHSY